MTAGLGLANDRLALPVRALSGGERRRLELARILFGGSDLLMLDEPTNHLDADAKHWLMKFLASYRGRLIVVSHDLKLLDASITRILHVDRDQVVEYRGTYSQYRKGGPKTRSGSARSPAGRNRRSSGSRRSPIDARPDGQARQEGEDAGHACREADGEKVEGPAHERSVKFRFPEPPHSGKVMLFANDLAKSYGGPPIFEDISFDVGRGERLLIMGLNGAGKTSLLRILAGESDADHGTFRLGHGVSLGYYAQEHEGIHEGMPVIDHMRAESRAEDQALRALLGMFRLSGEMAFQDAGTLSGGEKTKLALAQLVAGKKNLLMLDEPTNNLDPPSRTAIAEALAGWPGSMILVSHDIEFVEALAPQRVLMMPDGTLDYVERRPPRARGARLTGMLRRLRTGGGSTT